MHLFKYQPVSRSRDCLPVSSWTLCTIDSAFTTDIMGFLKSCFDYPCPYDPRAVDARPPKYHVSRIVHPEEVAEKDQLCEKPPVYTEQAAPASSSGLAKSPSPCSLRRYQFACPACRYRYLRQNFTKWVLAQRKPYSAVTVQIDRLTSEQYEEDDMGGIIDLVDVIRIQDSGPTEAARAIRKKLCVILLTWSTALVLIR